VALKVYSRAHDPARPLAGGALSNFHRCKLAGLLITLANRHSWPPLQLEASHLPLKSLSTVRVWPPSGMDMVTVPVTESGTCRLK
jgi:hypothetical protein